MSSNRDQSAEGVYYDEENDPYDEQAYREDRRRFPTLPVSPWGLWPSSWSRQDADRTSADEAYASEEYESEGYESERDDRTSDGIGRYWDEGLITLLIVGGAALFVFPEPATSGLGVLLMGLGVVAWLVDWVT